MSIDWCWCFGGVKLWNWLILLDVKHIACLPKNILDSFLANLRSTTVLFGTKNGEHASILEVNIFVIRGVHFLYSC